MAKVEAVRCDDLDNPKATVKLYQDPKANYFCTLEVTWGPGRMSSMCTQTFDDPTEALDQAVWLFGQWKTSRAY